MRPAAFALRSALGILVHDTGSGIPADHHDPLFARFGQVQLGLTRGSGRSGLGLYISRKLAEQMGGTVVLRQSAPGRGSTFAPRLPAAGPRGPTDALSRRA